LKIDPFLLVYVVRTIIRRSIGRVCTHIKACKTATIRGKITTIAAVAAAAAAP